MPIARFEMPDGRIARFEVPEGTTPEQAQSLIAQSFQPQQQQPQGTGSAALDGTNAVSSGFNRGLVRLAGLPVDTVANVLDLGKAAIGSGYTAVTGKAPPQSLELTPRSRVVGSGDYLVDKVGKTAPGNALINPVNPEYEGGYLQATGAGVNAVINPQSRAQAINQAVLGVTGALGARLGSESDNPAWAVLGGLTPAGAQQAAVAGTKYAVRGGEQGRRQMEQRVQDLRNAGVEKPTLGLASGNSVIGGMENILQSTPGAVGVMSRARDSAVSGLRAKADEAANLASTDRGATEAGMAIQSGIRNFKDAYKAKQEVLYDRLGNKLPPQYPADVLRTRETLAALNADIPGAPALSKFFKNEKIQALDRALESDTAGVTPKTPIALGVDNRAYLNPATLASDTLPFEAVKKTRTLVGNEIADNSLLSSVPQSKWRALYGGISEDMGATARRAGPDAEKAFNRATDYTRTGAQRLERVAPFAQAVAPEQAFTAMTNAARENVSTLQAVKKTLPMDARGKVAGTVIERLGKATNSQQNESSSAWSPETFLTNWNKMSPRARDELFTGFDNAPAVKAHVESVAKATSMMRDSSKMWANPSGTGANLAARASLGALGLGGAGSLAGLVDPFLVGGAGSGLLGTNMLARGLTRQQTIEAMTRRNNVSPGLLAATPIPLFSTGLLERPQ